MQTQKVLRRLIRLFGFTGNKLCIVRGSGKGASLERWPANQYGPVAQLVRAHA